MGNNGKTVHELTIPDSGFPKTCFVRLVGETVLLAADSPAYRVGDLLRLKSERGGQIGLEHTITAIHRDRAINKCTIEMWNWREYVS